MNLNEKGLEHLLSLSSGVTHIPFLHFFHEEFLMRQRLSQASSRCAKCRKKAYVTDLVFKLAHRLQNMSPEEKQGLKNIYSTTEDILLTTQENGTAKTTQIA